MKTKTEFRKIGGWLPKEPVFGTAQTKSKANINKEMIETKRIGLGILDVIGLLYWDSQFTFI